MKKQLIRWGLVLSLLLALLPASASAATGTAKALFTWKASASYATNMQSITDNLTSYTATAGTQARTHNASAVTVNTPEGQKSYNAYYLGTNWHKADDGTYYGLPSEVLAGGETKATEGLDLCFTNGIGASTSGKEAVNVSFVYAVRTHTGTRAETNMIALDKLKIQAATNGTQWLDGSVGIRSWELIGRQVEQADLTTYLFRIETENLLNIEGLESGDVISNLRIQPHGDYYYAWPNTFFGICELTLNAYTTVEDFKAAVPDERNDLIYIGEQKMRDIVVARARAIAAVEWKSDSNITAYNENCYYGAGILFRGPMYVRQISKSGYEVWREYIQNGKYTGGITSDTAVGMDCMSFAYDAYSTVTRSYSWILWQTQADNALQLLGDLKTDESPTFTETDILALNSAEAVYKAYAQMKKGDVMVESTDEGSLHVRIATANAVVKYESDGVTIDPAASYVATIEESSTPAYYFKNSSGNIVMVYATSITGSSSKEVSLDMIKSYATKKGYTFLYGSSPRETTYSFSSLLDGYYVPFTLAEYKTGMVEAVDLQTQVLPTDGVDVTGGFTAVAAVDHHADRMRVTLEKLDGTVLYEESLITNGTAHGQSRQYNYCWSYTSSTAMNKALKGLQTGEYRIGVYMLAGPVTQVGADRSEVSQFHRFSIGHEHTCGHGHTVTGEWTNLNAMTNGSLKAGNYYLSRDYAPTWALVTTKNAADAKTGVINICLNGYTLSGENMTTNYLIYTNTGTFTVNICDCVGGGKLANLNSSNTAETSSAAVIARDQNTVNLYAGTITGNKAACAVSAISTFNMYGGAIVGNNVRDTVYLNANTSVFNLYGGTIAGNTNTVNGVVHGKTSGGTFNMTGGVISENTVPAGKSIVTTVTRTGEGGIISTEGHNCSDHAAMGWTELNTMSHGALKAGNYYLSGDYAPTWALVTPAGETGTVNICLNGYTLSGSNMTTNYMIYTNNGTATVNIYDCGGRGKITGLSNSETSEVKSAVIIARSENVVNLHGGTITGNNTACTVSAVSTFNLYGGTIAGNTGRSVIYLNGDTSAFNMEGGIIAGNTSTVNGVVHGKTSGGTFSMTGGTVSDNTVPEGKDVVTGVTRTGQGGTLSAEGHVCTDHEAMGWQSLNDALSGFYSTAQNYQVPAGKYYLESDLTLDKYLYLTGDVTLCLNGHVLTGKDGDSYIISFTDAWTLNIYDCSEDASGVIGSRDGIWKGATGQTNSAIIIRAGATVNLYGGSLSGIEAGHVLYIPANGTLNMYGGAITGNRSVFVKAGFGGVIHNLGTVNLYGGTVTDNQVPAGVSQTVTGAGVLNNQGGSTEEPKPASPNDHTHGTGWKSFNDLIASLTPSGSPAIYYNLGTAHTNGKYYLTADLDLGSNAIQLNAGVGDITLCLNGHTLSSSAKMVIRYNNSCAANLTICDCSDGQHGKVALASRTVASNYQTASASVLARSSGTFNLYGGTLVGGVTCVSTTVNLYGGKIQALSDGEVLYIHNTAASVVNVEGGDFVGYGGEAPAVTHKGTGTLKLYDLETITEAGAYKLTRNSTGQYVTADHVHNCSCTDHAGVTEWIPFSQKFSPTGRTYLTGGHYYLDDDFVLGSGTGAVGEYYIEFATADTVLCLNGHTLDGKFCKNYIFRANGVNVDICDCSKAQTGTITGLNVNTADGTYSVGLLRANGNVNLYGGTVTGITAGRLFYIASGSALNVYGGNLDLGNSLLFFSRASSTGSKVNLYGGKFDKDIPTTSLKPFTADGYVLAETGDATYGYTVVPQLITGATVENGEALDLKVSVDVTGLGTDLSVYNVSMTKGGVETTGTLDELLTYDEVTLTHHLTFPDVAAKEMGDSIAVTVTDTDGEVVTAHSFTVAEQFKAILASTDDQAVINLCVDALNYGAAAQARFGYNTDALVNADVTAQSTTVAGEWTDNLSITEGCEALYAATASLKEKLELNMYFDVDCANGAPAVYINGAVSPAVSTVSNGTKEILKVALKEIAPKDAKNPISVTVAADEGTIEVTDSLAGYIVRNASQRDQAVLAALKRYIDAAIALAEQAG